MHEFFYSYYFRTLNGDAHTYALTREGSQTMVLISRWLIARGVREKAGPKKDRREMEKIEMRVAQEKKTKVRTESC